MDIKDPVVAHGAGGGDDKTFPQSVFLWVSCAADGLEG